jgi:hypothetical protein
MILLEDYSITFRDIIRIHSQFVITQSTQFIVGYG